MIWEEIFFWTIRLKFDITYKFDALEQTFDILKTVFFSGNKKTLVKNYLIWWNIGLN